MILFSFLQELNVRSVTASQDKGKYGVSLKAEPDHVILGKRLKRDFKKVSEAIRQLTDKQLQEFRSKGEIVVEGHTLTEGDLRLSYTSADAASSQYEAHSDSQVLIIARDLEHTGSLSQHYDIKITLTAK